jgi:uncharacterized protein
VRILLNRRSIRLLITTVLFGLLVLPVTIPFRVLMLAGAALVLIVLEAGSLRPLGFSRPRWPSTLLWSIGPPLAVIVLGTIIQPQIERLLGIRSDLSAYGALEGNEAVALQLLAFALTSAAFGEEILFRGFLLHQLTAILGEGDRQRWVAIVISGLAFGLAHWVQGLLGVVTTGLVGLLFAWAWFRSGRNLWALILAHALLDTYSIALLYFGLRP